MNWTKAEVEEAIIEGFEIDNSPASFKEWCSIGADCGINSHKIIWGLENLYRRGILMRIPISIDGKLILHYRLKMLDRFQSQLRNQAVKEMVRKAMAELG